MASKLTRRVIDAWLRNANGGLWLWCGELRGFGAKRRGTGTASWLAQYRIGKGRLAPRRRVVLGLFPAMSADEARLLAIDHFKAGWRGVDPVAEKRAVQVQSARKLDTLGILFDTFYSSREAQLRTSSALLCKAQAQLSLMRGERREEAELRLAASTPILCRT